MSRFLKSILLASYLLFVLIIGAFFNLLDTWEFWGSLLLLLVSIALWLIRSHPQVPTRYVPSLVILLPIVMAAWISWPFLSLQLSMPRCQQDRGFLDCFVVYDTYREPYQIPGVQNGSTIEFGALEKRQRRNMQDPRSCGERFRYNWYLRGDVGCNYILFTIAPSGGIANVTAYGWIPVLMSDFGNPMPINGIDNSVMHSVYIVTNHSRWVNCKAMRQDGNPPDICLGNHDLAYSSSKHALQKGGELRVNVTLDTTRGRTSPLR